MKSEFQEFTVENLWNRFFEQVIANVGRGSDEYDNMKSVWYSAIFDFLRHWEAVMQVESQERCKEIHDHIVQELHEFIRKDIEFRMARMKGELNG